LACEETDQRVGLVIHTTVTNYRSEY
jgi:hypothetical protein